MAMDSSSYMYSEPFDRAKCDINGGGAVAVMTSLLADLGLKGYDSEGISRIHCEYILNELLLIEIVLNNVHE